MQTIIEVPHLAQYLDIKDPFWKPRSCAIISLAMVLHYHGCFVNVEEAIEKALNMKVQDPKRGVVAGHDPKFGWRHDAIVETAKHYGFNSMRTEEDTFENLIQSLDNQEPVIVNVYKGFNPKNGGHFVVLNGYFLADGELGGFYINDPLGEPYKSQNKFVKLDKFEKGWKRRAIYVKKAS